MMAGGVVSGVGRVNRSRSPTISLVACRIPGGTGSGWVAEESGVADLSVVAVWGRSGRLVDE